MKRFLMKTEKIKEKFAGIKFIRTFAIPSETEEQTTVRKS